MEQKLLRQIEITPLRTDGTKNRLVLRGRKATLRPSLFLYFAINVLRLILLGCLLYTSDAADD